MKNFILFVCSVLVFCQLQAQVEVTIYEIQGQQDASPYDGQVVKTTGIVTAVFGPGYFIQDGAGEWNGVYVYSTGVVAVGDEVEITGEVSEYFDLTEISDISDLQILSSGNTLPMPVVSGTWDVNEEALEGVLVKIDLAECSNPDLGYGEWELNDGSGPCRVDDMGIVYAAELGINYSVMGPLNYAFGDYKIEPRDVNDIQIMEALYFTSGPDQLDIDKNSFTIVWESNVEATTELYYGITPAFELGHLVSGGTFISHQMEISGLEPGLVYYVKPFSVLGADTAQNTLMRCATQSNSSGEIKVLFNHDLDTSVALEEDAKWTPNITDSVIAFIDMAQQTLDVTMYEQESEDIVYAINEAWDRGVQIRYITDDEGNNPALEFLHDDIPVLYGNVGAIMHNKFIVLDVDSEMDCWVMTGSLNHTENNLGWDFNNVICLQDQSLAKAFTMEFEEMWGSDGAMFNESNAKFGAEKTDNTPHRFMLGEIPVELYFSPSDGTTSKIVEVIDEATNDFEFGIMVFTENSLGNAVLTAHQRGVETTGIIDYVEYNGSEYQNLKDNGVKVRDYVNSDGTSWPDGPVFHHKYMIADYGEASTNPVLVTGSHNWSASAESINDENTLIVRDLNFANQFHQEFTKRFNDQITPIAMDDDTLTGINEGVMVMCLVNDFIPEGVIADRLIINGPFHGTAEFLVNAIEYIPENDFIGMDSLQYTLVNDQNSQMADTAWVRIAVGNVGIGETLASGFDFSLRQNSQGHLSIHLQNAGANDVQIVLYNSLGRTIAISSTPVDSGNQIINMNLSGKPTGIYFVELKSKTFRKTRKFFFNN